jgi:hypothetical protein
MLIQESSLRATIPENFITIEQILVKLSFLNCEKQVFGENELYKLPCLKKCNSKYLDCASRYFMN